MKKSRKGHTRLTLLSALVLAPLLTLGLMVDGERWEAATVVMQKPVLAWRTPSQGLANIISTANAGDVIRVRRTISNTQRLNQDRCTLLSCAVLAEQRRLDLEEQALFAKPPTPELLAALRARKGLENQDKLERISLIDRNLRRAQMTSALLVGADLRRAQLQGANLGEAQLQGANLEWAQLQGANLSGATLYRNGDPAQSALLDIRGTTVEPLSQEAFSDIQAMLKSISSAGQEYSLKRLKSAAEPGAAAPTFSSCLTDRKSQPKCRQTYDVNHLKQWDKFVNRLHNALATLSCENAFIASGIISQIREQEEDKATTRAGPATVLRARMQDKESCPGLADLSAEDKTRLEKLAGWEAERRRFYR